MIGEIIKVKGIDLLVLDEIDDNPFVIAIDLGIKTEFGEDSNNYDGSIIEDTTNEWLKHSGIPTIERKLNLMTLDGSKNYGKKMVKAAPLTIDEYRKYSDIIAPHIKKSFWLATGWSTRSCHYYTAGYVGFVNTDGLANVNLYNDKNNLAPAFILNKNKLKSINGENLKEISTRDLIAELNRRFC